jgi:hypothetical protein
MLRKLFTLSMSILLILILSSCATPVITATNKVLFTDFDPPPTRPRLGVIPEDDLVEALRTMGINQVKLTTTIEKWEQHQGREDTYYIKTYVVPE